jgi:hypothetical protein
MHLHTVYMAYSECLPTLLNPLAEKTCFSQVLWPRANERGAMLTLAVGYTLGFSRLALEIIFKGLCGHGR